MGPDANTPGTGMLDERLRSTIGRLYRRFRNERDDGTLGDKALEVLTLLYKNGPRTLTELSEWDDVSPASMSETVARLTSAGYAERSPDPSDRRKVLITATADGGRLAAAARDKRNAWLAGRLGALAPEDRRILERACDLLDDIAKP